MSCPTFASGVFPCVSFGDVYLFDSVTVRKNYKFQTLAGYSPLQCSLYSHSCSTERLFIALVGM